MLDALALFLFVLLFLLLLAGYPVSFTLGGISVLAGLLTFGSGFFNLLPLRVFGIMQNYVLIAVPLFVFMGVMLEKSGIAEELLETMAMLFGRVRGGLAISVVLVGALLAASTGIVGATVITMGLLSLPTMLRRGYSPELATGTITASGTLGQIIPPSIVLVLLGSVMNVPVGDLFMGAVIPGAILVGLYLLYILGLTLVRKDAAPAMPAAEIRQFWQGFSIRYGLMALPLPLLLIIAVWLYIRGNPAIEWQATLVFLGAISAWPFILAYRGVAVIKRLTEALVLPLLLVTLVLGSIFAGVASPTEAAAVGAFGAMALTFMRKRLTPDALRATMKETTLLTSMVFIILVGATAFGLVFRGLGGDRHLINLISGAALGEHTLLLLVLLIMFVAGFFIDFIEITFIIIPVVLPLFLHYDIDLLWLGILFAINLQTSFLTPPFGFALFYLKGVAPPEVTTTQIYRGIIPFIIIQLIALLMVGFFPELATWFPKWISGSPVPTAQ